MGTLYALSDPKYVVFVGTIGLGLSSQGLRSRFVVTMLFSNANK